jgi:hypothetical protein
VLLSLLQAAKMTTSGANNTQIFVFENIIVSALSHKRMDLCLFSKSILKSGNYNAMQKTYHIDYAHSTLSLQEKKSRLTCRD